MVYRMKSLILLGLILLSAIKAEAMEANSCSAAFNGFLHLSDELRSDVMANWNPENTGVLGSVEYYADNLTSWALADNIRGSLNSRQSRSASASSVSSKYSTLISFLRVNYSQDISIKEDHSILHGQAAAPVYVFDVHVTRGLYNFAEYYAVTTGDETSVRLSGISRTLTQKVEGLSLGASNRNYLKVRHGMTLKKGRIVETLDLELSHTPSTIRVSLESETQLEKISAVLKMLEGGGVVDAKKLGAILHLLQDQPVGIGSSLQNVFEKRHLKATERPSSVGKAIELCFGAEISDLIK
jgi:hypothetical protein